MTLVLCPICRQLLRPAPPGWSTAQNELPAGWDCPYAHAATTPPDAYEAARIHWLAHDHAQQPLIPDRLTGAVGEPCCSQGLAAAEVSGAMRRPTARERPSR